MHNGTYRLALRHVSCQTKHLLAPLLLLDPRLQADSCCANPAALSWPHGDRCPEPRWAWQADERPSEPHAERAALVLLLPGGERTPQGELRLPEGPPSA